MVEQSKCPNVARCTCCSVGPALSETDTDALSELDDQGGNSGSRHKPIPKKKAHWLSHPSQIISNFVSSSQMKATYFRNHQAARKQSWPRELATLKWMTSQSISQTDHMAIHNKWFRINTLCHVSMKILCMCGSLRMLWEGRPRKSQKTHHFNQRMRTSKSEISLLKRNQFEGQISVWHMLTSGVHQNNFQMN